MGLPHMPTVATFPVSKYSKVSTPTAASSVTCVALSQTHLLRLSSYGSLLIDLGTKKPAIRELTLPKTVSHPRGCFSRDGKTLHVLDAARTSEHLLHAVDVATLAITASPLKRGWHITTHPKFDELVVTSDEGTDLVTPAGKVVRTLKGARSISPDGAWCIVAAADDQDRVCALTDKGPSAKGPTFSATNYAWTEDGARLLIWAWGEELAGEDWKGKPGLYWLEPKSGKKTFLKQVGFSKDSSSGIDDLVINGGWAVSLVEGGIADHPLATVDFVKLTNGEHMAFEIKAARSHAQLGSSAGRVAVSVQWQKPLHLFDLT